MNHTLNNQRGKVSHRAGEFLAMPGLTSCADWEMELHLVHKMQSGPGFIYDGVEALQCLFLHVSPTNPVQ